MNWVWTALPFLLLAGCAANRAPFSAANDGRLSAGGSGAALYRVRTGASDWGGVNVRLRAPGVRTAGTDKAPERFVDIAVEINNDSAAPVAFKVSRARLDLTDDDGRTVRGLQPEPVTAEPVAPGSDGALRLSFAVPGSFKAKKIASFELFWALAREGKGYSQSTVFERDGADERVYRYWPYDPFWSPGWGGGYWPYRTGVSVGVGVGRTF